MTRVVLARCFAYRDGFVRRKLFSKVIKLFLYNYLLVFIKIFVTFSIRNSLIAYDLNIIAALIPSGQEINAKTDNFS